MKFSDLLGEPDDDTPKRAPADQPDESGAAEPSTTPPPTFDALAGEAAEPGSGSESGSESGSDSGTASGAAPEPEPERAAEALPWMLEEVEPEEPVRPAPDRYGGLTQLNVTAPEPERFDDDEDRLARLGPVDDDLLPHRAHRRR